MPKTISETLASDVWTLRDLNVKSVGTATGSVAEILKNGRPLGTSFITRSRITCDLSRSQFRDLEQYAAQFNCVVNRTLRIHTANTLLIEGMNRLKMHLKQQLAVYGRRDGDLISVHFYTLSLLPKLNGKSSDHPEVRDFLLANGDNEIYTSSGAWERLDQPDWDGMSDAEIEHLAPGLMAWPVRNDSVVLGTPGDQQT